ncbi:MAG: sigma-70 family RNA polymerase sigma factor [Phycisphaerales bacterium]
MYDATRTTTALLSGLHDVENAEAWTSFYARYVPILIGVARRLGLSEADAQDAAQETLATFVREYRQQKYDRGRGRLRSWLLTILRTRVAQQYRARAVRKEEVGVTRLGAMADERTASDAWEAERRRAILLQAIDELRKVSKTSDQSIQIFEMLARDGRSAPDVAEEMGLSAQDVYRAKSRVAQRLREVVTRIEAVYDGEE